VVVTGLFCSRALMSIGMIGLFLHALLSSDVVTHFKSFKKQPHLLFLTFYFLWMTCTYFWSEDKAYFSVRIQVLLPFLVLPFSFAAMQKLSTRVINYFWSYFLILITLGMMWSLLHYLPNKESYDIGYGQSHMIPTPFKNDHIRFSLAVVFSIFVALERFQKEANKWIKGLCSGFLLLSIVYLHILSSKTGLLLFYSISFVWIVRYLFSSRNRMVAFLLLVSMFVLPYIMYNTSTTFRNKIGYVRYSIEQMNNQTKQANISDEGRLISYSYAIKAIQKDPIFGVGLGDVFQKMSLLYDQNFPNQQVKVLLPHNQFLMAGMAGGIIAIGVLLALLFFVFALVRHHSFLVHSFFVSMLFAMMVEPLFETQYGSCMFLFFLLLLLQQEKGAHT
jgi:O-antigen ligase